MCEGEDVCVRARVSVSVSGSGSVFAFQVRKNIVVSKVFKVVARVNVNC